MHLPRRSARGMTNKSSVRHNNIPNQIKSSLFTHYINDNMRKCEKYIYRVSKKTDVTFNRYFYISTSTGMCLTYNIQEINIL